LNVQAGVGNGCDKSVGNLLYTVSILCLFTCFLFGYHPSPWIFLTIDEGLQVATKFPANALKHRADLCKYISNNQVCMVVDGKSDLRELLERVIVVTAVLHGYSIVVDIFYVSSRFRYLL